MDNHGHPEEYEFTCPKCGNGTDTLHEGYCESCCDEGNAALALHNAEFDRWERMSDAERDAAIQSALSGA